MRKSLLLSVVMALCCMFKVQHAKAQITSLRIYPGVSHLDSFDRMCTPATLTGFLSGDVTGTHGSLDSLIVHYDSGDGSDTTFKIGIGSVSGSSYYFASLYGLHTYTTPGTYTAKAKVTAPSGVSDSISQTFTVGTTCAKTLSLYGKSLDSLYRYCHIPYGFSAYLSAYVTGTITSADSAIVHINYGDGTDSSFVEHSIGSWGFSVLFNHTYTMSGTYTPVIDVDLMGLKDTLTLDAFLLSDSCATLHGKLYLDDNNNCVVDAGEVGLRWVPIRLINTVTTDTTWVFGWTDTSGEYAVDLPAGTYEVTPIVNYMTGAAWYGWGSAGDTVTPTCPSSGTATLTVVPLGSYVRDFAYDCTPADSFDFNIAVSSTCYVPGDTALMSVWGGDWWRLFHYSCLSLSTTATLTLDSKLTYVGHYDGLTPASVSGSVITWNLSGFDAVMFNTRIMVAVSTSATIGDTLRSTAYIAPATGVTDPYLPNNTHNYARAVVSSFDPNMKESAPNGTGEKGIIPVNTPMTYTIHFQNTGTAPAKNITVVDELENDLDPSSFHMLTATHNVEVYRDGKTVKFRFNNINLPDSGSNYFGSMGAVTFAILPKRDLAPGTEIKNNASIYFDYNAPVITNYTLNTIESGTAIQEVKGNGLIAHIFPNPAHTELNVSMDKNDAFTVTMTDMLGRVVSNTAVQGAVVIPTQQLPAGLYLLSIKAGNGRALNTKVMVQH